MAGLAALGGDGIAKLRLVPAAEGVQVIEQHRDAQAMRRIPLLITHAGRRQRTGTSNLRHLVPRLLEGHRQIAAELAIK
jgi:hypothetical protein